VVALAVCCHTPAVLVFAISLIREGLGPVNWDFFTSCLNPSADRPAGMGRTLIVARSHCWPIAAAIGAAGRRSARVYSLWPKIQVSLALEPCATYASRRAWLEFRVSLLIHLGSMVVYVGLCAGPFFTQITFLGPGPGRNSGCWMD